MPHSVRINDYTNQALTLTSAPYVLLEYNMGAPTTQFTTNDSSETVDISGVRFSSVTDTLTVMIERTTATAAQSDYESLEQFISRINLKQNEDSGIKTFIEVQMTFDQVYFSSEIISMQIKPTSDSFIEIPQGKITAEITVNRQFFWENLSGVTLTGTNGNGASTTLTIKNHDDGGAGDDNWASFSGSTIKGTIPGPIRITLKNTSGSSVTFKNVYLGVNGIADPTNFQHVWEAESASGGSGSNTSDANSSNGSYRNISYGAAGNYPSTLYWLPPTNFFSITKGRIFRALLVCKTAPPTNAFVSIGAGVFDSPLFLNTWVGNEVQGDNNSRILDLGNIRLPQSNFVTGTTYSSGFSLNVRTTSASALTPDFIMFIPASGYKKIEQQYSLQVGANEFIIDDSEIGESCYKNSSGNKLPIYTPLGNDLMLWPGSTNRVYVLFEEPSYVATRSMQITVEHFARRLTF